MAILYRSLLVLLLITAVAGKIFAQPLDPYRRINDPLAIADLGGPDSGRIIHELGAASQRALDADGYNVLASDTGTGILRHLWGVYFNGLLPSDAKMKLWVDDSLLIDGTTEEFFKSAHGFIRPPFDTSSAGAEVCETQIPYHRNFRWTQTGDWLLQEAAWQRIDTSVTQEPWLGSALLATQQRAAESNYWKSDPMPHADSVSFLSTLPPGDTLVLAALKGPAYIQKVHFQFAPLDTAVLHRLWFSIRWDNCPTPSVALPLSDLFGIAMGVRNIRAFRIVVDSAQGTLDFTFPMPFKVNAQIVVVNMNETPVRMEGNIAYYDTIWHSSWGYFGTQYHVTPEITFHLFHPVLHAKGAGRYIGAIFNVPDSRYFSPCFMEGDGYLMVDSIPLDLQSCSTHYWGMEDYCDGGWYYLDTSSTMPPKPPPSFSLPFRGCPNWWSSMYRFHINAPFNYVRSMDVDFGHGFNDDYTTTYRTTSFYYERWTPFYPSSDTTIAGNPWTITGAGYAPDTPIVVTLDSDTIYQGRAAPDGSLAIRLVVPARWSIGDHALSINRIELPERITVLQTPKLLYVQDTAGRTFSEGDSIEVRGYGFKPNERLTLLLGDSLFGWTPRINADSDGTVRLKTFLPWVPQGHYHLKVIVSSGAAFISDSSLFVTRTLNYEFELLPVVEGGTMAAYSYLSFPDRHWSQGAMEFCYAPHYQITPFAFQFTVPAADTYSTTLFSTTGDRYGIYRTSIDSTDLGTHDWFLAAPWGIHRDSVILPNIYLTAGVHTIHFVNEGRDDSAVENSIGPDNLTLTPLSGYSGYFKIAATPSGNGISIYPNPLDRARLSIAGIPDSLGDVPVVLYNEIGQAILRTHAPPQSGLRTISMPPIVNGNYRLAIELPSGTKVVSLHILR